MWQQDGWGARARIGILVPHFDLPERFLKKRSPGISW